MTLASVDDDTFISYAQTVGADAEEFYDIEEPRGILINHAQDYYTEDGKYLKKLSGDVLNLREGDTLAFAAADGDDASAKTTELAVGAVTYERPMGTLIQSFYASTLVVTEAVFNAVTNDFTEDQTRSIQHAIYLSTGDDQRLERQLGELTQGTEEISIHNIRSAARAERNISVFLGVFVYGFIILISVICIANIFNTVSTNIALRRKEFAMLRSVGMTPKSFNRMIRFESIFYGLKGLLYGLPISVAIAFLLHNMQQSVLSTPFTLAWHSYAFAILMILVIVFATMLYATKTIKKENIINALKEDGF
jgi:putative ABC transport system permease protein